MVFFDNLNEINVKAVAVFPHNLQLPDFLGAHCSGDRVGLGWNALPLL